MSLRAAGHSEIEARFGTATGFQISAGNGAGAHSSLVSSCQETQQQTKGVLGHPKANPPPPSTAFPSAWPCWECCSNGSCREYYICANPISNHGGKEEFGMKV